MNTVVDARGLACPLPVVKANQAMAEMKNGTLEVHVDNTVAVENLKRLATQKGLSVAVAQPEEKHYVVSMDVTGAATAEVPVGDMCCGGDLVVAIDSDTMGRSSEELGAVLMKGFIFALTQLPVLPKTILFYNGGVKLTTEGSASLEDLRGMADRGVDIFSCGTCLNFYGLTDKLAVGGATNMYAIVETLQAAGKVIKP